MKAETFPLSSSLLTRPGLNCTESYADCSTSPVHLAIRIPLSAHSHRSDSRRQPSEPLTAPPLEIASPPFSLPGEITHARAYTIRNHG